MAWTTKLILFAGLAIPVGLAAQDDTAQANKPNHHHYQLIDMGTLGGPQSRIDYLTPSNNIGTVDGLGQAP